MFVHLNKNTSVMRRESYPSNFKEHNLKSNHMGKMEMIEGAVEQSGCWHCENYNLCTIKYFCRGDSENQNENSGEEATVKSTTKESDSMGSRFYVHCSCFGNIPLELRRLIHLEVPQVLQYLLGPPFVLPILNPDSVYWHTCTLFIRSLR